MVINISIHDLVNKFHNVFKKNMDTFDVLTFIQMRTVLTDKKYDLSKVSRMTIKFLTRLKLAK